MKQCDVYSHPVHGFQAVKNGFSWPGFFFNGLWMLLCRMWVGAAVVIGVHWFGSFVAGTMSVSYEDSLVPGLAGLCFMIIVNLIVGRNGNAWRRSAMARRGFKHLKSIEAQSADAAIAKVTEEATGETSP